MLNKGLREAATWVGILFGSLHAPYNSLRAGDGEGPTRPHASFEHTDALRAPCGHEVLDTQREREKLKLFISRFNQIIPRDSYPADMDSPRREVLLKKLIDTADSDSLEDILVAKQELLDHARPLLTAISKHTLFRFSGVTVTEMSTKEMSTLLGLQVQDEPYQSIRGESLTTIRLRWHGIPFTARLNELMMVDGFIIDGVNVSLADPLTRQTATTILDDIYDLTIQLKARLHSVTDVVATSRAKLDFEWNGERYVHTSFGLFRRADQQLDSLLNPVKRDGSVDSSVLVEEQRGTVRDRGADRVSIQWSYMSGQYGERYRAVYWQEGVGLYAENIIAGRVVSRETYDNQGIVRTRRDLTTGVLDIFDPSGANRVCTIIPSADIDTVVGDVQVDFSLRPDRIVPANPPPVTSILYGRNQQPLELPLPQALQCITSPTITNQVLDDIGARIDSLGILDCLTKYRFKYVSDAPEVPTENSLNYDDWKTALQTANLADEHGVYPGDCEDLAFLLQRLAAQGNLDLPVVRIFSYPSAHAIKLLVRRSADGGYTATTLCNFGIDRNGACNSDTERPGEAFTIEEALRRVFVKYPHPSGLERVPVERYEWIPCISLMRVDESGSGKSTKYTKIPLEALLDRGLREEIVARGGIESALFTASPDEHPWLSETRLLLDATAKDRVRSLYLTRLIERGADIGAIAEVAYNLDLATVTDSDRDELIEVLLRAASYPYAPPQLFEISLQLLQWLGAREQLLSLLSTRISACDALIAAQAAHPSRSDSFVLERYREALCAATAWSLFHEKLFDQQSANLAKSAFRKLCLVEGSTAAFESLSSKGSLEELLYNDDRARVYHEVLGVVAHTPETLPSAYRSLANYYVRGGQYERACEIYIALVRVDSCLFEESARFVKQALSEEVRLESYQLARLRAELLQVIRARAEQIQLGLQKNDFKSIKELIILADALSSAALLKDACLYIDAMALGVSVPSKIIGIGKVIAVLEELQHYTEAHELSQIAKSLRAIQHIAPRKLKKTD